MNNELAVSLLLQAVRKELGAKEALADLLKEEGHEEEGKKILLLLALPDVLRAELHSYYDDLLEGCRGENDLDEYEDPVNVLDWALTKTGEKVLTLEGYKLERRKEAADEALLDEDFGQDEYSEPKRLGEWTPVGDDSLSCRVSLFLDWTEEFVTYIVHFEPDSIEVQNTEW